MKLLVTGGSGFIGSAVVRNALAAGHHVVNVDIETYAASPATLARFHLHPRYRHERLDIKDAQGLNWLFDDVRADAVIHLAAESHVDRSIDGPKAFVETNVLGTFNLLEAARTQWENDGRSDAFRFLHVSTDEVFGSLGDTGRFDETSPYAPSSPYSASKAGADHLVRAWGKTYGLPVIVSNCSNNYGPYQFPEKLVPVVVLAAIQGRSIPVYGSGKQVRDWLYVDDHADALLTILARGAIGETYTVGAGNECSNLDLVTQICAAVDDLTEHPGSARLITHVTDRPGHDFRYAVDASKLKTSLGWSPTVTLREGLEQTASWFLSSPGWWAPLQHAHKTQSVAA